MMTASDCQRLDPLVTPYVDGQLSDAECLAVDAHLRACPPCHSRVEAERAVRELIRTQRAALGRPCAPHALHAQCSRLSALAGSGGAAAAVPERTRAPLARRAAPLA